MSNGSNIEKRSRDRFSAVSPILIGVVLLAVVNLSACSFFTQGRSVYDQEGIRIGLEADPSIRGNSQTGLNHHPIDLTPKDLTVLLESIQVSGYSGTIAGLLTKPEPVPLFTATELSVISEPLAVAFREAKPTERVFFSLPKPDVTYSEDRTVGALFYRGSYLHVVVTDHSSIIRTDTGGGDYKDLRDTKNMKLWVVDPAQAAKIPDFEEPRWAHFERVHISLPLNDVLMRKAYSRGAAPNQERTDSSLQSPTTIPTDHSAPTTSSGELQQQIRDLSGTNQELRNRLDEQHQQMRQLQEQLDQLRREVPRSNANGQSHKSTPAP